MNKPTKTSPKPLFIAELATVTGGSRGRGPTRLFPGERGIGTSRMLGEEGNPPDGISE